MEISFWNERWDNNQIGFHQQQINPYLSYFYGTKGPVPAQRESLKVFVPLCGKSKDMLWLAQNGYRVFGVECSELAVNAFFEENAVNYRHAELNNNALYLADDSPSMSPIEIYLGDFFNLDENDLQGVTDVYDRASLVALPEEMRQQYAKKMSELVQPGTRVLLVTLTYNQDDMNGPPFSVTEENVRALYEDNFQVDKLLFKDIIDNEPGMRERGLSSLVETVYKLVKK